MGRLSLVGKAYNQSIQLLINSAVNQFSCNAMPLIIGALSSLLDGPAGAAHYCFLPIQPDMKCDIT